jgi:EmrB/QacA subfamily drug resistance transporter
MEKSGLISTSEVDYSRKWFVMAAVATGIFLATIDGSIVNIALPTLVRDLGTDFATVQWVVLAYLLTLATLLLSIGRLADMKGKKPIYTLGFAIFTIGSVLCGLAPNVLGLIGFRILQAVGATMILALGMAIVTESFPPHERGKALGLSGSAVSIGIIVGPTLGGLIIEALSWHWIFFVNLPVGILGIWMVLRFVPATKPSGEGRFDFAGALALFFGLLALSLALTMGQEMGYTNTLILTMLVMAAILLAGFIVIELRVAQPMVDLRLFQNRLFSINLVTGFITFIAISGTLILTPFYLENVRGYDTRQVGLMLAVVPFVMGFVAPLSGSLSDRFGTRTISAIGLCILAIGYYALSKLDTQTSTLGYLVRFMPIGIGMGMFQSPNNSAIMGSAPRQRLGIVSGMLAVTRSLGQTTGIALMGSIWASRVIDYAGTPLPNGATSASPAAQVAGLQDTFLLITMAVLLGLGLSILGVVLERRTNAKHAPAPASTNPET